MTKESHQDFCAVQAIPKEALSNANEQAEKMRKVVDAAERLDYAWAVLYGDEL